MRLPPHLSVRNGHLHMGDHDLAILAEQFGTPLYVTSEERIRENYRGFHTALSDYYPKIQILYAAKANGNATILTILASEGAGADVFSSGELALALQAGMKPEHLLFNGSSKSPADLARAVESGIRVSVDSLDELHQLNAAAAAAGRRVEIAFRVNPALQVPTHPKIATGLASSKFGIPHASIPAAYGEALACEHIDPVGIHCHIGSQILAVEPFTRAAEVMMEIAVRLVDDGVDLQFVDLGGGLGIPYQRETDAAPTYEEYAAGVMPVFLQGIVDAGIRPELWVEPGRSLVADSTVLLARVNSVKKSSRQFANVDAGFNLLVRPVMYDAYHEVVAVNKADQPVAETYTIAGPICESGDLMAIERMLPPLKAGDVIALLDAGAYGFAMASQYNARPRCAEVLLNRDRAACMRRGEGIDDIAAAMIRPPWL